jgi:hypothetical protein
MERPVSSPPENPTGQKAVDLALMTTAAALERLSDGGTPVSVIVEMSLRVARLRGDAENLVWLTLETRPIGDEFAKRRAYDELTRALGSEQVRTLHANAIEEYIVERQLEEGENGRLIALSVGELEARVETLAEMTAIPPRLEGAALRGLMDERARGVIRRGQFLEILARIRARLHEFLTITEVQLLLGEAVSGIFEDTRSYVDIRLQQIAPDVAGQLVAAFRRRGERDEEARSHALTSCRRALKTLADVLYPARGEQVVGADGESHDVGEDKYLNRLLQYVNESTQHLVDAELLVAQIENLGLRLRAVRDLAAKGVHADVTAYEVDQCVIQTYLTIGDLLHLTDEAT